MKSDIDQYVINRVKELRLAKKMSQAHLANELDVSIGFIGMIESPKYRNHFNLQHLNKLAVILECSPKEFLPDHPLI
ncbi:helix-turn-helix transcriptional regulator [Pedobacter sp. UYP1]|uniref:helix-turn-helix domain-containing protein n=1 Tax=Pedobacter sp. UYP1 TaxID=1756396 RepID=UPI0033964FA4